MSDLTAKLDNLQSALTRLAEGVAQLGRGDDLQRDGVIQRFEFTFELTWKTLKAYFEEEGLQNLTSPKSVLREAYAAGIIGDEGLWLDMLRDRNLTTHIYKQELAKQIAIGIEKRYLIALQAVVDKLKDLI
ncbi:MAG: nucleotidyltransferase substrate binding protein [Patescibacteria group bacterium]